MQPVQACTSNQVCIDVLPTATNFASTKSVTMCRHKWKALCVYVDWKGSGKQQAKGKNVTPCQNKCLHPGHQHQGGLEPGLELLSTYLQLALPSVSSSLMIVARVQTLVLAWKQPSYIRLLLSSQSLSVNAPGVHAKCHFCLHIVC